MDELYDTSLSLPNRIGREPHPVMQLRHIGDYRQPGVSLRQAERAVRMAEEFFELLTKEVVNASKAKEP